MRKVRVFKGVELVFVVTVLLTVSISALAQSGKSSTPEVSSSGSSIFMKHSPGEFRTVQEALKESANPAVTSNIPDEKSTAEQWTDYFKTQLEAAGKMNDPTAKMNRLAEIASDLFNGLMNGANISADSAKAVMAQITSFINSDAFKKLAESSDTETQAMVSMFLTVAQDTMNSAVKKYGDKLDQATVNGLKDALKKYEGKVQTPSEDSKIATKGSAELVTSLYHTILGREPDTEGLKYWVNQLESNKMSFDQIKDSFYNSKEFKAIPITGQITALYRDILQREPDTGGLKYWMDQLSSGKMSFDAIKKAFYNSEEYKSRFGENVR